MSISEKIVGVVTDNILTPKVQDAAEAFIDTNFVDKRLEESIVAELLDTYPCSVQSFWNGA